MKPNVKPDYSDPVPFRVFRIDFDSIQEINEQIESP